MSHPLTHTQYDPTWTDPRLLEPAYGIGRVKATIYVRSIILDNDIPIEREIRYSYQVTVNGMEVFAEIPDAKGATDLNGDIRAAIETQMKFDILNLIEP